MPKRPTKSADTEPAAEKTKKKQSNSQFAAFWHETNTILRSTRFRIACGVVLMCFVVYAAVSYFSYFFSGAEDYSMLNSDLSGSELRNAIQNRGGVMGARLQDFFVDRAFGVPALSLLVLLAYCAVALMKPTLVRVWKVFFHSAFWLIWGSVTCAFIQKVAHAEGSFFRWGGSHGEFLNNLLLNAVDWLGALLIILAVLVVYMIGVNRNTIPVVQRFYAWVVGLFSRKKEEGAPLDEGGAFIDIDGDGQNDIEIVIDGMEKAAEEQKAAAENIIDLGDVLGDKQEEKPASNGDLELQIENIPHEPEPQEPETLEPSETSSSAALEPETLKPETLEPETSASSANPADDLEIAESATVETIDKSDPEAWLKAAGPYDPRKDLENFKFPSLDLLKVYDNENAPIINEDEQRANANRIVTALRNYGVEIEKISATVGPTVTLYEVVPKAGVKISKIQNLEADIMMTLAAKGIRIIAPMPGKGTVGIEVPNEKPQTVSMHSVIASKRFQEEKKMRLPIALGRTITNDIFMFDLAKTPHLLVAGATGQGKSVAINAIITSLLYKKHPAEMKLVMVDPKMVEFAPYKPLIRHYLAAMPDTEENDIIITDCSKVIDTLNSLVIEMENRYKLLMDAGVRNLEDYNDKFVNRRLNPEKVVADTLHHQYLPYIVIVIDEYGDFIMQAGKQVETPIARITQKARAVGMHMILATQRPSVNIVTGVIKANIPTRIALRTQSLIDSRTVLDTKGAEQLIGRGDLLYAGSGEVTRVQCAFVDTPEVDAIVEHIEEQQHYFAPYELPEYVGEGGDNEPLAPGAVDLKKLDSMFMEVARYVVMNQQGSTSVLQRRFEIGYNRAGKLTDQLEAAGIVSAPKGPKGRDVLIQDETQLQEVFHRLELI